MTNIHTMPVRNIDTERIQANLEDIEREYNVKIIRAVEGGSRSWGFASPDSDFDVRFVFIQPLENYLTIRTETQVIERVHNEGMYDFVGWDLRKALGLLLKGNATIHEWLRIRTTYRNTTTAEELLTLSDNFFNRIAVHWHYLNMARSNFEHYLRNRANNGTIKEVIKAKKLLYVARPLLIREYVERFDKNPPDSIWEVIDPLPIDTMSRYAWNELISILQAKSKGIELGEVRSEEYDHLLHWCEDIIMNAQPPEESGVVGTKEQLDSFFYRTVLKYARLIQ